VCVPVGQW
jgi:ABC-type Fe3+ transport system permease subunit